MLALMAAMSQEIAPFRDGMKVKNKTAERGCAIFEGKYRGRDLLLVQSGVGRRRAQRAARLTLERHPVGALVSFGFAGALNDSSRCGDVVVYDGVACGDPQPGSAAVRSFLSDEFLAELAARAPAKAGFGVVRANGVSVSRVVCEPGQKRGLGQAFCAGAVDMESYWIAEVAQSSGVPFVAVRAISDGADDRLPAFDRFMDSNGWRWSKALPFFAGHPDQVFRLWRLRSSMRAPARNLATVLDWVVDNVYV